jgi:hypothetical protein
MAARSVVIGNPDIPLILRSTYGPPLVLLPFVPFAFFPEVFASYLVTFLNIFLFILTFYLLWKRVGSAFGFLFWFLLGLCSYSFPLQLSLGMGNPIGIVTFGIYAIWTVRLVPVSVFFYFFSSAVKIFPFIALPVHFIATRGDGTIVLDKKFITTTIIYIIGISVLGMTLLPSGVWSAYRVFSHTKYIELSHELNPNTYNQSFSSTLARFTIAMPSFSPGYWLFVTTLLAVLVYGMYYTLRKGFTERYRFNISFALIVFSLLVHPFPWQHYFAVFLPLTLVLFVQSRQWRYFLVFILLSLDLGRYGTQGIVFGLLGSTQFIGAFVLYVALVFKDNCLFLNRD